MNKRILAISLIIVSIILIMIVVQLNKYSFARVNINEIAIENSTINGKKPKYNNPIIPKGFKSVKDGASWNTRGNKVEGWNSGLVIEDESGNQFVWVPVKDGVKEDGYYEEEGTVAYKNWCIYDGKDIISESDMEYLEELLGDTVESKVMRMADVIKDTLPSNVEREETQIEKYGGFYIARYEAGIDEKDLKEIYELDEDYDFVTVDDRNNITDYKSISKKNAQVWDFIEYSNAKAVAENSYKTENVQSGLMTGKQFDTIMRWAKETGYDLEDANSWGNFLDTYLGEYTGRYASYLRRNSEDWKVKDYGVKDSSIILYTGTGGVEKSKMNQIYDIAGNLYEFTADLYKGKIGLVRGGSAAYSGKGDTHHPVTGYSFGDSLHYGIGFRVVLYIK